MLLSKYDFPVLAFPAIASGATGLPIDCKNRIASAPTSNLAGSPGLGYINGKGSREALGAPCFA